MQSSSDKFHTTHVIEARKTAVEWMNKRGIIAKYEPKKKGNSDKNISASTALPSDLEVDYGWKYHSARTAGTQNGSNSIQVAVIKDENTIDTVLREDGRPEQVYFIVPPNWLPRKSDAEGDQSNPEGDEAKYDLSLSQERLHEAIKKMDNEAPNLSPEAFEVSVASWISIYEIADGLRGESRRRKVPLFVSAEDARNMDSKMQLKGFDIEMLLGKSSESHNDKSTAFGGLETLLGILSLNQVSNATAEISIERHWGKALPGVFMDHSLLTISNQNAETLPGFGCWKTKAKPDFLSAHATKPSYMRLAVLVGEAKLAVTEAEEKKVKTQMAVAIQPTLQLFAALLTNLCEMDQQAINRKRDTKMLTFNPFNSRKEAEIPDWMRLYGLRYDKKGIHLCVFFLTYTISVDENGKKKLDWHYNCMDVDGRTAMKTILQRRVLHERLQLLVTLLVIKKSALNTASEWVKHKQYLPKNIVELDEASMKARKAGVNLDKIEE